jgi:cation diffusion facilitator family transporter
VLIVVAALLILREAYFGFQSPKPLDAPWQGLAVNGVASLMNAAWSWVLVRQGRRQKSPALVADGRHLLTDVISSIGVIGGVALAALSGWAFLDPALAVAVALGILWSGWGLMKESRADLWTKRSRPRRWLASAKSFRPMPMALSRLTRHAGRMMFIDFHLVVPSGMVAARIWGDSAPERVPHPVIF